MNISARESGDVIIVDFEGKLNTTTSPEAEAFIGALVEQGAAKILLNFAMLDFISSTGLRVVLYYGKKLGQLNGEIRLCSLNDTVAEIFDMSGFSSMFKVFGDEVSALNNF